MNTQAINLNQDLEEIKMKILEILKENNPDAYLYFSEKIKQEKEV